MTSQILENQEANAAALSVPRTASASPMLYRAYVEGFTGHFATVADLKVWAEDLSRRPSLNGKTQKIWKAVWAGRECAEYHSAPTREIVIGA